MRPIEFTLESVSKSPVSGVVTVVVVVSVVVVVVVVTPLEFCDVSSVDVEVEDSKVPGVQSPVTVEGQFVPSASSLRDKEGYTQTSRNANKAASPQ